MMNHSVIIFLSEASKLVDFCYEWTYLYVDSYSSPNKIWCMNRIHRATGEKILNSELRTNQ